MPYNTRPDRRGSTGRGSVHCRCTVTRFGRRHRPRPLLLLGWDTAVNLNEESKQAIQAGDLPGQACVISMFLLPIVFVLNIVAVQMLVPSKELAGQGPNLLFYFSEQVGGSWIGNLMIFAVLSSTVAGIQTTLLPASQLTFSMSRDEVFLRFSERCRADSRRPCSAR
ncbi:MAG TPA: amino acid permease [Acidimicrobiales bacterium]|nr:amino acid permease [Acidimicrobiales bacterium]